MLLLLLPLCTYAGEISKAKVFGIAGFTFSLVAIGADILSDHYRDKYEEATSPGDVTKYKDRAVIYERTRNISFGLAVVNFSLSTIFWLTEKKSPVGLEVNYKKEKLCVGLRRVFQ